MKIGIDNLADAAALTASAEMTTLPATNTQHEHLGRKWRTPEGTTAASLFYDMASALTCALVAILGTNFTPTGTIRVRASNVDPTCVGSLLLDTGALTGSAKAGYGAIYKAFAATAARYWRIDLSDAAVDEGYLDVGRVFLGPEWACSAPQRFEWAPVVIDRSILRRSYGGQVWADRRPKQRGLSFVLDWMNEAEMYANAFRAGWEKGVSGDVLAIPDINGAYLSEQAVFGQLLGPEPLFQRLPQVYTQKYTVIERL